MRLSGARVLLKGWELPQLGEARFEPGAGMGRAGGWGGGGGWEGVWGSGWGGAFGGVDGWGGRDGGLGRLRGGSEFGWVGLAVCVFAT